MATRSRRGSEGWDYVITPEHSWFDVDLRAIWRYRDLCFMYVKRNFTTLYKQTILGPLWFFIQPIMTIVIYMFIFGGLAGISTEGVPQPLFYMGGILLWSYFTECFGASNDVFFTNSQIFGKVWFPRMIVPLAGSISGLFRLGLQTILFVLIYLWCLPEMSAVHFNWVALLFPVFVLMSALHAISWGLIISSITYKYRDIQMLVGFFIQLFMYLTPVVYPLDTIPESYKDIVRINPLSSIFETFKYGCFSHGSPDWTGLLYSMVFLLVVLSFAILIFNRTERTFMDTV